MENVLLIGENTIDDDIKIMPFCIIKNSIIKAGSVISEYTYIENSIIDGSIIGKHSIIVNSNINKNCLIDDFCKIENSNLLTGCIVNNYCSLTSDVENIITIGKNVVIGPEVKVNSDIVDHVSIMKNNLLSFYKH